MEAAVDTFTAFTGASPEVARRYLGMTEGNAEQAIQLFFDSPDLASGIAEPISHSAPPPIPSSSTHPAHGSNSRENTSGTILVDSDDDDDHMHDRDSDNGSAAAAGRAADYDHDEAIARRLQEEMYTGGGSGGDFGDDEVRAPIARTTETLVGGADGEYGPGDIDGAVLEQMRARQYARQGRGGPPGVFNQRPVASIWDNSADPEVHRQGLAQATGGASEQSSKAARLAELFRPPFELMSHIPWDIAREKGKENHKWLLVNIQDPSIFDCQQLNRDIWKDDGVRELVKEHFIFMQYSKDDPRGSPYIQYYFPLKDSDAAYPHIAIVDPRTGEQLKVWSGRPTPNAGDFLMQLVEFLDRYSFDMAKKNPVAKRKVEKPKTVDVDKLTEEEMLDLALHNSLANSTEPIGPKGDDPDAMTKSFVDEGKGKGKAAEEEAAPVTLSPFLQISSHKPHIEPTNQGADVTRIQFRHSDGRIVRKFEVTAPVRRMYEWLKAEPISGKEGIPFELKDRGKDLMEHLDQTIEEAGLKQSTVMVEFLEDS